MATQRNPSGVWATPTTELPGSPSSDYHARLNQAALVAGVGEVAEGASPRVPAEAKSVTHRTTPLTAGAFMAFSIYRRKDAILQHHPSTRKGKPMS